ncbi:MAG: uracil-DNA glycosylase [Pyrinomonadaceae bacterium]
MQNEFSILVEELNEQILYLKELGVENFNVDLPEADSSKFKVLSLKSDISQEKLARFVPSDVEMLEAIATKPTNASVEQNKPRTSILEASKLSSLPKRNSTIANPLNNPKEEQTRENTMPVKTSEEMPSLFGEIAQTLPESIETIEEIRLDIGNCTRCTLCESRTKIVHSDGNREANLMFVGEAPGANEDAEGRPFVGKAGQLLNKIIESIGLKREDVFIGNVNRCRPPQNRQPTPLEAATCKPFLLREISVVRPKVIVVLGNTATQNLLGTKVGITKLRGEFQDYFGVKVMPTFHPAYLLRDPSKKRETWEDMKKVRDFLNQA